MSNSVFRLIQAFPLLSVLSISIAFFSASCDDESPQTDPVLTGGESVAGVATQGLLRLDHPIEGQILNTHTVRVEGIHSSATEVMINGQAVPVMSQRFSAMITLEEGGQRLQVNAGEDQVEVNVIVDTTPPTLTITEPAYGTHLDSQQSSLVTVIGVVNDGENGSGTQSVTVNGQEVLIEPNGRFTFTYEPELGLNRPLVIATDYAGHQTDKTRGFLFGRFKPWESALDRGLRVELRPEAFDIIAQTLENTLKSGIINNLVNDSMGFSEDISITEVIFRDIDVQLSPQEGYISLSITFFDLKVFFELSTPSTRGDVYISPAHLTARLELTPRADGSLDAQILDPMLTLDNLDIQVENALLDTAVSFVEGYVRDFAEQAILTAIEDALVGELLSRNLFSPEFDILGISVRVRALFQELNINTEAARGELGIKIEDLPAINNSVGYLYVPTFGAPTALNNMASADVQLNALYSIFSHLWYGGLLNVSLSDIIDLPSALNAALLSGFTEGALLEYMAATEKIGVRLKPTLPPIARFDLTKPSVTLIDLVDLHVDLTLPDGRAWFTLGLDITASVSPSLNNNQLGLEISLTVDGVKVDEPLFPVKSKELIGLIVNLIKGLPEQLGEEGLRNLFDLNEFDFYGLRLSSGTVQSVINPTPYVQVGINLDNITQ